MRQRMKLCTICGNEFHKKGILGFYFCGKCKSLHHISRYNKRKMCTKLVSYPLSKRANKLMHSPVVPVCK